MEQLGLELSYITNENINCYNHYESLGSTKASLITQQFQPRKCMVYERKCMNMSHERHVQDYHNISPPNSPRLEITQMPIKVE